MFLEKIRIIKPCETSKGKTKALSKVAPQANKQVSGRVDLAGLRGALEKKGYVVLSYSEKLGFLTAEKQGNKTMFFKNQKISAEGADEKQAVFNLKTAAEIIKEGGFF